MIRSPGPPDFAPRSLVEGNDVGVLIGVAILDHHVADEQWRGGGSPGTLEPAHLARPDKLAVDGVAIKPSAAPKEGVDALTVRCTGRRRPAVHAVRSFRFACPSDTLPEDGAIGSIDAHHHPSLTLIEGAGQKDALPPDRWR